MWGNSHKQPTTYKGTRLTDIFGKKSISTIQEIIKHRLCISCGACVSAAPLAAMKMVYDENQGIFVPKIIDQDGISGAGMEFAVCPGKGYPLKQIARDLYGTVKHETYELGRYRYAVAAHINKIDILENASSGGVMSGIALYLMENGLIQGATATRFIYGPGGPKTEVFIARNKDDLLSSQGSKYCPTTTNELIRECIKTGGKYLFIGTPCQVGALRLEIRENQELAKIFPYTMANFCGGYRNFHWLNEIAISQGANPSKIKYFRFRGGGQPGTMLIRTNAGNTVSHAYPDYVRLSLIPKQKRCWYCVDATGELADFSCGDAWLKRYQGDRYPWSIILARSRFAEEIVRAMTENNWLQTESISHEEICRSQKSNITSKLYRQHGRMRVSRLLGIKIPDWDVELKSDEPRYFYELFVLTGKTRLGVRLQKIRLWLNKLLNR